MNILPINLLIEKYAELSGVPVNHFEFHSEKGRNKDHGFKDHQFEAFFGTLYDSGSYANLIFTNNSLSFGKMENLFKNISYPILAFININQPEPVVIHKERGILTCYHVDILKDAIYAEIVEDVSLLLANMLNVKDIDKESYKKSSNTYSGIDQKKANDVFFITGIPVKSNFSSKTEHNEHLTPAQRLFRLMKGEKKEIKYIYFFAVLMGIVNLALPLGIQSIITLLSGGMIMSSIVVLTLIIVVATGFAGYLQLLQLSYVEILQQRVFVKAAYEYSYRIPKIKLESISKEYGPELVNRFFDVLNIQKALPKFLIDITSTILQIFFGLLLLSFYHSFFILFGIFLFLTLFIVAYYSAPKGLKTSIMESKYKYKVANWLEELARNAITFKLAGYTNLTIDKTDNYLSNYLSARSKHFDVLKTQYISIIAFKTFVTAGILISGGILVFNNQINIGQFIAAELIIVLIIASVEKLINTLDIIYDLLTALDKVGHVTDIELENNKGVELSAIPDYENFTIEMKNLSYQYENSHEAILKNINFTIKAGEKVCLAGHNDSGKSSLVRILTGIHHNYNGIFCYNNVPVHDINIYSYRDMIGENLSHDEIFDGTIEENITVGKKGISTKDLLWAITEVGLKDFINCQSEGLRTKLTSGGGELSSNIKQKLILARSIAEMPMLIVMDDEFFTEQNEKLHLINVLFNKEKNWSLFTVTNDPLLLAKADKILYLNKGEIEMTGTFAELILKDDFRNLIYADVDFK